MPVSVEKIRWTQTGHKNQRGLIMKKEIDEGGPVFPLIEGDLDKIIDPGITVRVLLAGLAMQGILASGIKTRIIKPEELATTCLNRADAIIKKSKET